MKALVTVQSGTTSYRGVDELVDGIAGEPFVLIELDEMSVQLQARLGFEGVTLWDRFDDSTGFGVTRVVGERVEGIIPVAGPTGCSRVRVVATPRLVAVVSDGLGLDLDDFRSRIRWGADQPMAVSLFLVVQLAVRSFQTAVRDVRRTLDALETAILDGVERGQVVELHMAVRRVNAMRRALIEYRDALVDSNDDLEADEEVSTRARQLADRHASRVSAVLADLELVRDEAATTGELYRSLVSTRQDMVINRLTVISALLLPLTVLTGFFGMNFGWMTDALGSPAAFWLLGVVIPVATVAVLLVLMWRSGWLLAAQDVQADSRARRRVAPGDDAGR